MREIDVGIRFDLQTGPTFFGTDEVNAVLRAGGRVESIDPGGVLMKKMGVAGENVRMTVSGFTVKVRVVDP